MQQVRRSPLLDSFNFLLSFHSTLNNLHRLKFPKRALEADILDKEAKEMERNLKILQERMQQQNIEDESIPKFGGSRWKSARPDKGSVTSYAKSVQDKHRKKSNGDDPALLKSHSMPRLAPQKEKAPVDFRSKGK